MQNSEQWIQTTDIRWMLQDSNHPHAPECIRMLWGNKHTFPLKHDLQGTLALPRPLRRLQLACYSEICCCPINNYLHHWSILLSVANEDLAESLHYCPWRQFMKFHPFLTSHCTDLCSLVISSSWHNRCKVSLRGTIQSTDKAGVTWRSHTWTW